MVNYFFFRSKRVDVTGADGSISRYIKLFPLSGQYTPSSENGGSTQVPVLEELPVVCSRADTTMRCNYPVGTVFGVRIVGNTAFRSRLKLYSNNGEQSYNIADCKLFPLDREFYQGRSSLSAEEQGHLDSIVRAFVGSYPDITNHRNLARNLFCLVHPDQPMPENLLTDDERRQQEQTQTQSAPAAETPAAATQQTVSQPQSQPADQEASEARRNRLLVGAKTKLDAVATCLRQHVNADQVAPRLLVLSRLLDNMAVGVCKFKFRKQNGDERIAYGTLCPQIISQFDGDVNEAHGNAAGETDGAHICFFDVQRRHLTSKVRSFCVEDFLSLESIMCIMDADSIESLIPVTAA